MEILGKPLTKKAMKVIKNKDNIVEGIISVCLADVIDNDLESFLDEISEKLTGSPLLMDINYSIVGGAGQTIFLKVSGDVSEIL